MNLNASKKGKVVLVGAGPGREDLITLAGRNALREADVILYDALVNKALLKYSKSGSKLIYVGKRSGRHSMSQNEINTTLVEHALSEDLVVRLKGGDPFVFGRASEEIECLENFGISVEVIPGVTSAIAVPSSQGIPLTKRGVATSFWVMTATCKEGNFSNDLKLASQSSATMVILMGVGKIDKIINEVSKHRSFDTPMALIQNGTLPSETCITSTLEKAHLSYSSIDRSLPGIIVIGDVVAEHNTFFDDEIQRVLYSYL